jgi:hypothetical protein
VVGTRECACICNPKKGKEKKIEALEALLILYDKFRRLYTVV